MAEGTSKVFAYNPFISQIRKMIPALQRQENLSSRLAWAI
jgi:hypothetical protein